MGERDGYPLAQHLLGLVPLTVVLACIWLGFGSEEAVEAYCTGLRERSPWLIDEVEWISDLANGGFYLAYAVVLFLGLRRARSRWVEFVGGYLLSLLFIFLMVNVVKFCAGRPRPWSDDPVEPFTSDSENHSFPSGHVTETIVTTVPWGQRRGRIGLPLLFGVWPVLVALTRLYLGEHHPSDFVGSMLVGSLGLYLGWNSRPVWGRVYARALAWNARRGKSGT